jgi:zinc and cadmium transporter
MSPQLLIGVYCLFVVIASLLGGWLPSVMRLTHTRLQILISAVGGLMLGIGLFHLLPHAVGGAVTLDRAIWWLMMGLLTTFFLIRVFHGHSHGVAEPTQTAGDDFREPGSSDNPFPSPPAESHSHHHGHQHDDPGVSGSRFGWVGIALGLSLHTALDGVALSASVLHDQHDSPTGILWGFAVFLGVLLHKPLDSLSITSLMSASGWPGRTQQIVNFGYALMCPIGAAIFLMGVAASPNQEVLVGCALAFAAGIFICLSLSDLLPELQFHSHDRLKLTAALLLGVAAAYGIGYLEPEHVHDHSSSPHEMHDPGQHHDHEHADPR